MLFPSEIFLFTFLPIAVVLYYCLFRRNVVFKNIWLLAISLFFYAWGEPIYVFLMIAVILFNYALGMLIEKANKGSCKNVGRLMMILTVIVDISVLGWYKYAGFIFSELEKIWNFSLWNGEKIALPIGISFFTFQALSYVIDVYRGNVAAEKNPFYVGLYVSFFPQLIAGPIVRYSTVNAQIKERKESVELFSDGVNRFLWGLTKKVIIANNMAVVADGAFELIIKGNFEGSMLMAWLGAISYTFKIYFDFSGYSDMAIGLGKIFGFEFLENFNYPYISSSVTEFWRRWHISLSTWFRDYVYIPLGGSRYGKQRTVINLFIVWLLTGIWHGANWTFLIWGLTYFIVITIEKAAGVSTKIVGKSYESKKYGKDVRKSFPKFMGHIYTMFIVIVAWVLFRSESLMDFYAYLKGMFGINVRGFKDIQVFTYFKQNLIYYVLALIGSTPLFKMLEEKIDKKKANKPNVLIWNIFNIILLLCAVLISISFIMNKGYSPFIYFNF